MEYLQPRVSRKMSRTGMDFGPFDVCSLFKTSDEGAMRKWDIEPLDLDELRLLRKWPTKVLSKNIGANRETEKRLARLRRPGQIGDAMEIYERTQARSAAVVRITCTGIRAQLDSHSQIANF